MRKVILFALAAIILTASLAMAQAPAKPSATGPYTMKLIAPVAGDKWDEGSTQTIAWTVAPSIKPDSIMVVLLADAKDNMSPLKEIVVARIKKEDPGKWIWEKVSPAGDQVIEVRVYLGKVVTASASQAILIVPRPESPGKPDEQPKAAIQKPSEEMNVAVRVLYPNGKEQWRQGTVELITWSFASLPAGDNRMVDVYLSRDGGKTYSDVLAKQLPPYTSELKFEVTGPMARECLIKVALIDHDGKFPPVFDVSDGPFQILPNTTEPPTGEHR